jgi:hypothetical protein
VLVAYQKRRRQIFDSKAAATDPGVNPS